jgi:large subunit ribosomal protein L25
MAKTSASQVNQLRVVVRTETGKGASRRARRDGKIPAVLYGHGTEPRHLELPGHDFAAVLRHHGTNAVLTLDIEGKNQLALTRALAIHPIRRTIQHADLLVVRRGEKVVVEVTVHVEGGGSPGTLPSSMGGGPPPPARWSLRRPAPSRSRPKRCRFPKS